MSHKVSWPPPLTRVPTIMPGQFGVPGTDARNGLRQTSEGVILYVDPNHTDANDQRDGTNPEAPLRTVTAALLQCQAHRGDTIVVMANNGWQYGTPLTGRILPVREEIVIAVPGVRLVGVHPSGSLGVYWTPAQNAGTCITVRAIDVLVEGFLFGQGAFAGCRAIFADWNGATAWGDNLTVRKCAFDDTVDIGIQLEFAWYVNIYDNEFWECDAQAIYVDPLGSGAANCNIHDNIFHDCGFAIAGRGMDKSHIYANSIYCAAAQGAGAATDLGIDLLGGLENQVFDNSFSCKLPVPAAGDWDDLNTAGATDAWINNHCMNGNSVTNPT